MMVQPTELSTEWLYALLMEHHVDHSSMCLCDRCMKVRAEIAIRKFFDRC